MRASVQCDIVLDEVQLSGDAVRPGVTGLKGPFSCLNDARDGIRRGAMSAARNSDEAAPAYALERRQLDPPIASFQLPQRQ